jgi:hypothetical protein
MSTQPPDDSWLPPCFFENQRKISRDQLLPYAGQHIAWSWDGTRILASAPDAEMLFHKLVEAGHNPFRAVFDYVPPPGVSYFS